MKLNYSFYIKSLKNFLFFLSFSLVVLIFFNKTLKVNSNSEIKYDFKISENEQIVIDPKFIGIDKKERPFKIQALQAVKTIENKDLFLLEKPSGEIKNTNGGKTMVKSLKGKFDQKNQKVYLFNKVELANIDGLVFKTESAQIDLESNEIVGKEKIFGENNEGKISSEGFEITDQGNKVIFTGKANLLIKQ